MLLNFTAGRNVCLCMYEHAYIHTRVSMHACVIVGQGTSCAQTRFLSTSHGSGGTSTWALGWCLAAVLATMGPAGRAPGTGPCVVTFMPVLSHAADSFQGSALSIPLFLKIVRSAWGLGESRKASAVVLRFRARVGGHLALNSVPRQLPEPSSILSPDSQGCSPNCV